MLRKIYRWRLLAPVLSGTLLAGGCQLTGADTLLVPSPNATLTNQLKSATTPPPAFASATADSSTQPKPTNAGLVDNAQRPVVQPADGEARVAANVTRISDTPAGNDTGIPPVPPLPSPGQAGVAQRTDPPADRDLSQSPIRNRVDPDSEMTMKFNGAGSEFKALAARVQQLEQHLEQRDRAVRESGESVKAATEQLNQVRTSLQKIQEDTRSQFHSFNQEQIEYLRMQNAKLEAQLRDSTAAEPIVADRK